MIEAEDIEKRIDRVITAPIPIENAGGGIVPRTWGEAMEFAKLMAISGAAVPKWLRNNPGGCLAICSRALRWRMEPFAVAEKSYLAIGKGGTEHIGYEAQLVHAVVIASAPLKGRLRYTILGAGDERRCKVWGTFKGETQPHEYTSETLGKKIADIGTNDKGQLKGSPLWLTDPEVQLAYSAVRQWARLFSPETLLGVYTPDEIPDTEPVDVTPPLEALAKRLAETSKKGGRGFSDTILEGEATEQDDENDDDSSEHATGSVRRPMATRDRADDNINKGGSSGAGEDDQTVRPHARGQVATRIAKHIEGKNTDLFSEDQPKRPKRKR
jgi:RecT family